MHRYTAVCLAGAFCFLICGSRAEASNLLPAADEGIASVMTEAYEADPAADEKVLEEMTPSDGRPSPDVSTVSRSLLRPFSRSSVRISRQRTYTAQLI